MARGKMLALMDVVENTGGFSGKGNFQVAIKLWKTLQKWERIFREHIACVLGLLQMLFC